MGNASWGRMAGHSAKKNAKANASTLSWRFNALIAINVAFVGYRIVYHWGSFGWFSWMLAIAAWIIYGLCYSQFQAAASSSLHNISDVGEYWSDLFLVTLAAQALAIFSDFGWL